VPAADTHNEPRNGREMSEPVAGGLCDTPLCFGSRGPRELRAASWSSARVGTLAGEQLARGKRSSGPRVLLLALAWVGDGHAHPSQC
jgi:hypothetical protein